MGSDLCRSGGDSKTSLVGRSVSHEHSTMKSANAGALIEVLGQKDMSNSLSLTIHLAIRPEVSGRCRMAQSGWSMSTTIGCA